MVRYQDAQDRLRDAQRRYEANRSCNASETALSAAIKDVLVARADIESCRRAYSEAWHRQHPDAVCEAGECMMPID
jgi:DnaJ-domain-containing protein 1